MWQWVLHANSIFVPRRSLICLTPSELCLSDKAEAKNRAEFDTVIKYHLGDSFTLGLKKSPGEYHANDQIITLIRDTNDKHLLRRCVNFINSHTMWGISI